MFHVVFCLLIFVGGSDHVLYASSAAAGELPSGQHRGRASGKRSAVVDDIFETPAAAAASAQETISEVFPPIDIPLSCPAPYLADAEEFSAAWHKIANSPLNTTDVRPIGKFIQKEFAACVDLGRAHESVPFPEIDDAPGLSTLFWASKEVRNHFGSDNIFFRFFRGILLHHGLTYEGVPRQWYEDIAEAGSLRMKMLPRANRYLIDHVSDVPVHASVLVTAAEERKALLETPEKCLCEMIDNKPCFGLGDLHPFLDMLNYLPNRDRGCLAPAIYYRLYTRMTDALVAHLSALQRSTVLSDGLKVGGVLIGAIGTPIGAAYDLSFYWGTHPAASTNCYEWGVSVSPPAGYNGSIPRMEPQCLTIENGTIFVRAVVDDAVARVVHYASPTEAMPATLITATASAGMYMLGLGVRTLWEDGFVPWWWSQSLIHPDVHVRPQAAAMALFFIFKNNGFFQESIHKKSFNVTTFNIDDYIKRIADFVTSFAKDADHPARRGKPGEAEPLARVIIDKPEYFAL